MNKMLELVEAQKLFNCPENKIEILIHPDSLVHAIIEFKNGLTKFLYHETSMVVPLANAIFENKVDIDQFKMNKKNDNKFYKNLFLEKVDPNIFPVIKLKKE